VLLLAVAGVGYAFASRVADAFGTSNGATVGFIVVAVLVIAGGTWLAWKKGLWALAFELATGMVAAASQFARRDAIACARAPA
jgi:hypothetical protein